eukprot:CAMPEP_0197465324 /NCGR_PEP_ID=MMETSP1175-20131217/64482_1 /TAXON_ID=1003142 /ORGANISM="Triceratium dubium, Strain CCMP147" /LENGTH=493 /DNA_ID=CAMNT_0043001335 /DNA_START=1746 /DNA_END=3227 /DNA_ORIENTATION=-
MSDEAPSDTARYQHDEPDDDSSVSQQEGRLMPNGSPIVMEEVQQQQQRRRSRDDGEMYLSGALKIYVVDALATLVEAAQKEADAECLDLRSVDLLSSGRSGGKHSKSSKTNHQTRGGGGRQVSGADEKCSSRMSDNMRDLSALYRPVQFLAHHLLCIANSTHIAGKDFRFVASTPHNREAFLVTFADATKGFVGVATTRMNNADDGNGCGRRSEGGGTLVTPEDFLQLLRALCPDFNEELVRFISHCCYVDDSLPPEEEEEVRDFANDESSPLTKTNATTRPPSSYHRNSSRTQRKRLCRFDDLCDALRKYFGPLEFWSAVHYAFARRGMQREESNGGEGRVGDDEVEWRKEPTTATEQKEEKESRSSGHCSTSAEEHTTETENELVGYEGIIAHLESVDELFGRDGLWRSAFVTTRWDKREILGLLQETSLRCTSINAPSPRVPVIIDSVPSLEGSQTTEASAYLTWNDLWKADIGSDRRQCPVQVLGSTPI